MVLGLGGVLVLCMLLVVVQHVGHPPPSPVQPGIMSLLMVLGVHAGKLASRYPVWGFADGGLRDRANRRLCRYYKSRQLRTERLKE